VAFGILPVFAFANAGVNLTGLGLDDLLKPIPLGIVLGLVIGKQVGVFAFAWLAVKLGVARLPAEVDFRQVYGVAVLCGIGFTMSLFIGMLAFENSAAGEVIVTDRLGVLAGSLIAAVAGYVVLQFALPKNGRDAR
jgi:NhaA family Na+:H+ antiporter